MLSVQDTSLLISKDPDRAECVLHRAASSIRPGIFRFERSPASVWLTASCDSQLRVGPAERHDRDRQVSECRSNRAATKPQNRVEQRADEIAVQVPPIPASLPWR